MNKTEIIEALYPLVKELAKFETVYGSMAYLPNSPRVSMTVSYWAGRSLCSPTRNRYGEDIR